LHSSRDQSGSPKKEFELTDFQYALLVLFNEHDERADRYGPPGRSPYEIERWMKKEGGSILGYSVAQVYKQAKDLHDEGYLISFVPENLSRRRTYYELTTKGSDALRQWFRSPTPPPPIDDAQAFIRLRGNVRVDWMAEGLLAGRAELEFQLEEMDNEQTRLKRLGAFDAAARLRLDLRRSLVTAYYDWLGRVDAEWGPAAEEAGDPN
jgi:DNA-binding PadR family transcriptional regulator